MMIEEDLFKGRFFLILLIDDVQIQGFCKIKRVIYVQ